MFVYGSIEDHMFVYWTEFFKSLEMFLYIKMTLLRIIRWISNLPKYSFHNEHQSHFSELSGGARKTLKFAGEPREVAIE